MKITQKQILFSLALLSASSALYGSFAANPTQNFLNAVANNASPEALEGLFTPIDVNKHLGSGHTALTHYASRNNLSAVDYLLFTRGASPDIRVAEGNQDAALHYACSNINPEIVNSLLTANANPNTQNASGHTPLTGCIVWHQEKPLKPERMAVNTIIYRLITQPRIDLDLTENGKQQTALMLACLSGQIRIVKSLLAAGADSFIADINENDALDLSQQKNDSEASYNVADKFVVIEDLIKEQRANYKKEVHNILTEAIPVCADIITIITAFIPKEKYRPTTVAPKCSSECHCSNPLINKIQWRLAASKVKKTPVTAQSTVFDV